jgi:hypothetical protein
MGRHRKSEYTVIPAIVLSDNEASMLSHLPVATVKISAKVQTPTIKIAKLPAGVRTPPKFPPFRIPAKVTPEAAVPVQKTHDSIFNDALFTTIERQNFLMGHEYATVRREGKHDWTIMGSANCEYVLIKLDESYTSFHLTSLLPETVDIDWKFSGGFIEKDIVNALTALFV